MFKATVSVHLRMLWEGLIGGILLYFYSNVIQAKICVRFEAYQRVKFEVAEFMNFKWLYLGVYLELGDKREYFRIQNLMDFQNI